MRYNKWINEAVGGISQDQLDKLARDCKPFLKDVKKRLNKDNNLLFRGMKGVKLDFGIKAVRQDRRPLDSDPIWHKDFGDGFVRKFGIDARSKGLFVEIKPSVRYGDSHMIFPVGNYYCLWSDTIADAAEWVPEAIYDYGGDGVQNAVDNHVDKLLGSYHKGSADEAIAGVENSQGGFRTEVTVICRQYYYIKYNHRAQIEEWIENEL